MGQFLAAKIALSKIWRYLT